VSTVIFFRVSQKTKQYLRKNSRFSPLRFENYWTFSILTSRMHQLGRSIFRLLIVYTDMKIRRKNTHCKLLIRIVILKIDVMRSPRISLLHTLSGPASRHSPECSFPVHSISICLYYILYYLGVVPNIGQSFINCGPHAK